MGMTGSIVSPMVGPIVGPMIGDGGNIDPLVFHALDDVAGVFSADVIVGTGNIAEARTSTIYLPDDSSPVLWKSYATTVPGEYYAGGKWWLYGAPAATNQITWSSDLTNPAWTQQGTAISAYDAVGLEGVANTATTLTDDDAAAFELVVETLTIPDDSNTNVLRAFVAVDNDETRFSEFQLQYNGGTRQEITAQINTKTGAIVNRISTGTTANEVNQVGNWWEVLISVANNSTGNTSNTSRVSPARATTIGLNEAAATGSIIIPNIGLGLNRTIASLRGSSPIFNAGATGSINITETSFDLANHDNTQGGYFINWTPHFATSEASGNIEIISLNGGADLLYYDATNSLLSSTDGTNTASVSLTVVAGTTYKCWAGFGSGSLQVGVDAATGTATNYDGAFATGTKMEILGRTGFTQRARDLRRYNQTFAAVVPTLQALAA